MSVEWSLDLVEKDLLGKFDIFFGMLEDKDVVFLRARLADTERQDMRA